MTYLSVRSSLCLCVLLAASGCNLNAYVADTTGKVLHQAAPSIDAFFDYETAGAGLPGVILQLEAFYSVTPHNELLALDLAKAYVGFAQGWIENEYEVANGKGDADRAERERVRARNHYLRARNLALFMMRQRDAGLDAAMNGTEQDFAEYLAHHYTAKDDVAPIFWAGLAWGAAINVSLDDPGLIADLPRAKALVERALQLDDLFFNGAAYLFLATAEATLPAAMGGNPEKARDLFEKGLERTGRKNHLMQLNYARVWAVNNQDRQTYHNMLEEILESGDLGPSYRLSNKVARVKAERAINEENNFF